MKKSVLLSLVTMIFVVLLLTPGCKAEKKGEQSTPETPKKPVIAVSIVPQKAWAEAVCGDLAEIVVLVPPGNSPANYEPTPQEMEQFSKARLYFALGVPTEEANILPRTEDIEGIKIIKLQEEVASVYPDLEIAPGNRDPHIWLSPKRAMIMVTAIAREMSELDPTNKEAYLSNAESYLAELEALDKEIKVALTGIEDGKFIVFHPAFGYLAADYGLEMFALEQDGKEATPQRLQEMIDLAKRENIKAIFYQEEISGKQAEAFAEEIGGRTVQLAPLSAQYIENLRGMAEVLTDVMK